MDLEYAFEYYVLGICSYTSRYDFFIAPLETIKTRSLELKSHCNGLFFAGLSIN